MANTKISALSAGTTLAGTEAIPAVQSAATVKVTPAQIKTYVYSATVGSDTQVLFNNAGAAAGDAGFTYDVGSSTVSVPELDASGEVMAGDGLVTASAGYIGWNGRAWMYAPADGIIRALNNAETAGAAFELTERTAPSSPASDKVYLYAEDVSGTTKLRYKDSAGTVTTLGAGGSPGGSDTQIQFNDSSSFGGDAGLTYNKTTNALTLTSGSLKAVSGSNFLSFDELAGTGGAIKYYNNSLGYSYALCGDDGGNNAYLAWGALGYITWQSTNRQDSGSADTGLARLSAGVLRVTDGSTGYGSVAAISRLNTQTASYTLALTDIAKIVEINNASANNLTVPTNATVAFPIGTSIDIVQHGAGQTTVVAAGGVTINSKGGNLKLTGQFSSASLYKRGTNEWTLIGDLSA